MTLMLTLAISKGIKTAIMIIAMILVFYFFMIKPQSDNQKKERAYRDGLKKGDQVMTLAGIHGTIYSTDATSVMLEVAPGKRMRIDKGGICPIPTPKKK